MEKQYKNKKKRLAIYYLAHDGITSHYAGIGTYTKSYTDNFPQIIELLEKNQVETTLYLLTPKYKKTFYGYNHKIENNNLKLIERYGGKLIEVDNGTNGLDSYGTIKNWDKCSKESSNVISKYLGLYDTNLIIAVDTPFLRVGEFLNKINTQINYKVVLSPQSTEKIHNSNIQGRYEWEKSIFQNANNSINIFVSYSSLYIKKHLLSEYKVNNRKLIPSMSGLSFSSHRYKKYTQDQIKNELTKYGIPTNRFLVFTVGRLEPYKGFIETIKLFKQIDKRLNPYLIMLGFSYLKNNPLIKELEKIKRDDGIDGKFIFKLDLILPTLIWQWKNSRISAHISQFEPFGLAPTEARLLAKDNGPVVVVSNQGGLPEQISNNKDGFIVKYGSIKSYKKVVNGIFKMNGNQLTKLRKTAYQTVIKKYNSYENIIVLLSNLDKDIEKVHKLKNKRRKD